MKTGGRRFEKVTYTIVIIALLLLPTLSVVLAYNSGLEVTGDGVVIRPGGGPWVRGIATWMTYKTYLLEPGRLDLYANIIMSVPEETQELSFTWTIDKWIVRDTRNITLNFAIGFRKVIDVQLVSCNTLSCSIDEQSIALTNWLALGLISAFFSMLVIGMVAYEERWKRRLRSWL